MQGLGYVVGQSRGLVLAPGLLWRTLTRLDDKRDDFNFPIVNFPGLSSNIPSEAVY